MTDSGSGSLNSGCRNHFFFLKTATLVKSEPSCRQLVRSVQRHKLSSFQWNPVVYCRLWPTFGLGGCCKPTPTKCTGCKSFSHFYFLILCQLLVIAFCENLHLIVDLSTHQKYSKRLKGPVSTRYFYRDLPPKGYSWHSAFLNPVSTGRAVQLSLCLNFAISPWPYLHHNCKCKW